MTVIRLTAMRKTGFQIIQSMMNQKILETGGITEENLEVEEEVKNCESEEDDDEVETTEPG